ncbi:MAG: leucyl/phenylalanyl-tRNA--protein transferase [Candidatus Hydrogenedentota bacterium]
MSIYLLSDDLRFPSPTNADEEGLLAIGGDLSPERLVMAYSMGIFPWYSAGDPIMWWSPDPRMVIRPGEFRPSTSLRKSYRKMKLRLSMDEAFEQVIRNCSGIPRGNQEGTWITEEMRESYCQLHELGVAHSLECWNSETLVGGLYGLSLGNCFFGESMFAKQSDASKLAFWALMRYADTAGIEFVDCQLHNDHLESLGAYTIKREEYMRWLYRSLESQTRQGSWGEAFSLCVAQGL